MTIPPEPVSQQPRRNKSWAWIALAVAAGVARVAFHYYDIDGFPKLASTVQARLEASQLIQAGNEQMSKGDFAVAISSFGGAIRRDPGNAVAYADRALAHYRNEDYPQAKSDADKAASLDESNPVLHQVRGMLAMRDHRYEDARASFTRSLQLEPNKAFSYYQRALAYEGSKQYQPSRTDAEQAIRLQPDLAGAYTVLSRIYRSQGNLAMARAQADALLKVAHHPQDYFAAAQIRARLGQADEALVALDRGIAAAPDVKLQLLRAKLLPWSDLPGRRAAIQAALALNPQANEALLLRGQLEYDAGNYNAAIATYNTALADVTAAAPSLTDLLASRGAAYVKLGKMREAEQDFAAARATNTPAKLNKICWYLATHNVALETARDNCEKAVAQSPQNATILDSEGFVLLRLGRYRDSIASYDTALARQNDMSASLYGRGIAKRHLGNRPDGDADMRAALAIDGGIGKRFADYGVISTL